MADQPGESRCLWKDTATAPFEADTLAEEVRCDVAVVGAGFTGLRAALYLAERGVNVVVVDSKRVGWGASGRSGGQVNPLLPVARPEALLKAVGPVYFERLAEVSLGSADELFALVRKYQIQCDARQNGWIRVEHCEAARRRARAAAGAWGRFGLVFEPLGSDDVARLTGSPAYRSGILWPKGGSVQPLSLANGLAHAAARAGARIYGDAPVRRLERRGTLWQLNAHSHRIEAETVIIATNAYTGAMIPDLQRSILPLVPIQIATKPLPAGVIGALLPEGHTIADTRRIIMYARREPDDRIVYGGIGYGLPNGRIGGFAWLARDAVRVFPALAAVRWRYRWGGLIALTKDHVPHFHELAPGLIAGLGYNGRGVAMSLVMGRVLAERAMGAAPETLPFPVSPIEPIALRDIQRLGAGFAIHWMRLLDRIECAIAH